MTGELTCRNLLGLCTSPTCGWARRRVALSPPILPNPPTSLWLKA